MLLSHSLITILEFYIHHLLYTEHLSPPKMYICSPNPQCDGIRDGTLKIYLGLDEVMRVEPSC